MPMPMNFSQFGQQPYGQQGFQPGGFGQGGYQPFQQYNLPEQTWGEWFWGANPKVMQLNKFAPNQQSAMQSLLGQGLSGAQNMQQFSFDPIAAQARQQFQQQTVPSLAERFSSMGQGGQHSSAFAQQLGGAGADLESQLAALRSQFGLQQQGQQMNWLSRLLGLGLESPWENQGIPGTSGFLNAMTNTVGQNAENIGKLFAAM